MHCLYMYQQHGIAMGDLMNDQNQSKCSCLGSFDTAQGKCVCEPGWNGATCSNLNTIPIPDSPEAYNKAIYTAEMPTWGGSILEGDGTYFFVGASFTNSKGLSCWPSTSTAAIWESANISGPWKPISYVGFGSFPGYKAEDVPWNHNAVVTVERKLSDPSNPDSTIKYALVIYSIMQRPKNSDRLTKAYFGPPNNTICTNGWAKRFPVSTVDQETHAAYIELKATNEDAVKKEITALLRSKTFVTNINGYPNRNEYVNTKFNWVNLKNKVPNPLVNMVNPAPLISYASNYGALIPDPQGQYYRMLALRIARNKEAIGLLKLKADKFIWEADAKYTKGPLVSFSWNTEDPYFFESENGFHLITHDGRVCGNWNACGSITHYPKNVPGYNILADSNWTRAAPGWSTPTKLYNTVIPNLQVPVNYRQRPGLFFQNKAPAALLNGTIFAASPQTTRASRTFTQPISARL